ncbi:unnamed protein product [Didymodactylos carnosus]|uniref:Pentapeptide repeat-containing protein n=1 Tax=Didymodactylos carnosus TaxID=1234261 RepID=A0A814W235_9BILA|nr:unnamed protein product [Didymodactylos carnosus]CAF3957244.1 unnamed protein product [Didymodactylos carnosus]
MNLEGSTLSPMQTHISQQKSVIQPKQRSKTIDLTLKDCGKIVSSILIPILICIFTVVTTLQQHNSAAQQREQDNHLAQKQRELENDIAVQERLQDKQQQDDSLKENLFSSYLRDITDLTLHNKSININDRMQYIRSKILTTLRRLDSERKRNLILFLYESNLISYNEKNPQKHVVDLSGADLNNLNFTSTSKLKYWLKSINLTNVYLINATFINVYLHRADFTNSIMTDSSFSECVLSDSFFKDGILDRADLTNTVMQNTIFYSSSLFQTNFTNAHIDHVDFRNVNLSRSIKLIKIENVTLDLTFDPLSNHM